MNLIKIILSWAIALLVGFIFVRLLFVAIGAAFTVLWHAMILIPIIVFAIPIYIIVRKKILK